MATSGTGLSIAMAAAERARSLIHSMDRAGLDRVQVRALRLLNNRLLEAATGYGNDFSTPAQVVYSAVRQALSDIDKLERGSLDDHQAAVLREVVGALHEAEDASRGAL